MNGGKQNILSGAELKKRMIKNKLPKKYINEINLNALLEYEYEQMGGDEYYDTKIIEYCANLLAKNYTGKNYILQKETIYQQITNGKGKIKKPRKRVILIGTFATFISVLLCIQVISVTAFHGNFFGDAINWTRDMFLSLIGANIHEDDKKVEVSGSKQYKSVEEFEQAEDIDILMPEYMSNNIKITAVIYSYNFEEKHINVVYDDNLTSITIKLNEKLPDIENFTDVDFFESDSIDFCIFQNSNVIFWEHGNNYYNLTCGFDIVEYEKIIKSIK